MFRGGGPGGHGCAVLPGDSQGRGGHGTRTKADDRGGGDDASDDSGASTPPRRWEANRHRRGTMHAMAEAILERLAHLQVRFNKNYWAHQFNLLVPVSFADVLSFQVQVVHAASCSCHWQKKYETGRMEGRGGTMWSITMEEAASLGECTIVSPTYA